MTNPNEPIHDIAHLGHVELLTPKPEESLRFFVDVMGMTESGRKGDSVYLRGWDDYEHHSLQLTASPKPGLGHYAFRARVRKHFSGVEAIEKTGLGKGWKEDNVGHGPAYCFTTLMDTKWKFTTRRNGTSASRVEACLEESGVPIF